MATNVNANNPGSEDGAPNPVVLGVDFGTLSGRAVVVRVSDGTELGSVEHVYRHGVITDHLPNRPDLLAELGAIVRIAAPESTMWRAGTYLMASLTREEILTVVTSSCPSEVK